MADTPEKEIEKPKKQNDKEGVPAPDHVSEPARREAEDEGKKGIKAPDKPDTSKPHLPEYDDPGPPVKEDRGKPAEKEDSSKKVLPDTKIVDPTEDRAAQKQRMREASGREGPQKQPDHDKGR